MHLPPPVAVARRSARRELRPLAGSALLGVVGVALELARPWPLAMTIDALVTRNDVLGLGLPADIALAAIAVVAVTAIAGWLDLVAVVTAERAAERIGARLRADVFARSLALSPRWHDGIRSGELTSRLTSDVGRVLDALVALCSTMLPDIVRLGVLLALLLAINPPLALVAVAVVPALTALAVRQRRRVRATQADARTQSGRFTAVAVDLLRNVRAVQAFGRPAHVEAVFATRNTALRDANIRAVVTEARWTPFADITLAVGSGLVLVVGGHEVLAGRLSVGDLVVVTSYVSGLYSPVRGLSRLSGVLAKSTSSAERLDEILTAADEIADRPAARPAPRRLTYGIELVGVRFGYDPVHPVLDGLDLAVRAGETVCLFGPSGIGKSTILQLLLRMYDVDAGAVRIDGTDVRDLQLTSLRRRIAYVPQDPWLLDTTVADNITFGAPDPTWHAIERAARDARADEFVTRLPQGYDTVVGEGGARLSGGQRRRLALARAAMSDAPLVLLDEPTASLDQAAAAHVVDAIRRATAARTVLLVTHDHGLAELADRVVTLDRVATVGSRPAVPAMSGREVSS